jgi:hypothetical protein
MSKLDKDQVIATFTEAYTAANGKSPVIEAKGGWYSIDGGKNIRLAQVEELTGELAGVKPVKAVASKAAKKAAEPKKEAAAKKASEPKTTAPKKAAKKPKAKNTGFSVKAFWADKINEVNPGSQQPR